VATAAIIAVGSLLYVLQPEYRRVLEWNVGHLVLGLDEEQQSGLRQGDPNRVYYNGFLMMSGVGLLALEDTWEPSRRSTLVPYGQKRAPTPRLRSPLSGVEEPARFVREPAELPAAGLGPPKMLVRIEAPEWWRAGATGP